MKDGINIKYLISNEQDKLWGVTVNTVGHQHIEPNSVYPPKDHPSEYIFSTRKGRVLDEYVLLYISYGSGFFTSSLKEKTKIKAGNMLLLFPGEWHSYEPNHSVGWDEYWIGFKGEYIDDRIKNGFINRQKEIYYVGSSLEIVQLYRTAIKTAEEQKIGFQPILSGIASLLLAITCSLDKYLLFDQEKPIKLINQAKMIMFENSHTDIKPEDVADKICMSYSLFRHKFKQYTGISPHQYLQELRIQKSKELLISTVLTCQEIAYSIGYNNPEHFGAIFKKKTGISPIKYREFYKNNS